LGNALKFITTSNKNNSMKMLKNVMALGLVLGLSTLGVKAQENPTVGGAAMSAKKNIVENAVNSPVHTTLVAAVKAADLVATLQGEGPFTVFAPVNEAFEALPEGTVASLLKPENKEKLQAVLTYHVVAGKIDGKTLQAAIKKGKGKATYKTVQGAELTFMQKGELIMVQDSKGNTATVTVANVYQSNGIIHVIDTVLLP
jgi:uncharacterized surface protein with fasciclin (FAS1) repeats